MRTKNTTRPRRMCFLDGSFREEGLEPFLLLLNRGMSVFFRLNDPNFIFLYYRQAEHHGQKETFKGGGGSVRV